MNKHSGAAIAIAGMGTTLFTTLLLMEKISSTVYMALLVLLMFTSLTVSLLPQLKEFDFKNLKATLFELKHANAEAAVTVKELAEMYTRLEHLTGRPFVLDDEKIRSLGLNFGPRSVATPSGVMRYHVGCMKRERERLAKVLAGAKPPEQIAKGILDDSMDELVFKWAGPETLLDTPPKAADEEGSTAGG